jgi:DNA-binding NtrC family response regulator
MKILLAEDRASLRKALAETLARAGYSVMEAPDGAQASACVEEGGFDLALFDLKMPVHSGLELLKASRDRWPLVPVILLTAYGSVEVAVSAMKEGAFDFLPKPVDPEHLLLVVRKALDSDRNERLREALEADLTRSPVFQEIVGQSPALREVQEQAARIAATDTTCLILGETGVGKELFARAIHRASGRGREPFVAVNCAAIPGTLLENELFGHERGAYTGAYETAIGRFEYAHRGTIFLDEIGEMGPDLQSKLLRVLEERSFTRVGGNKPVKVDVRILCATNRDLEEMVRQQLFRQDLYYRLSAFPIRIPSLRERLEDIPALAEHFLGLYRKELGKPGLRLSEEVLRSFCARPWPGNVRELMNNLERAAILAPTGGVIGPQLFKEGSPAPAVPSRMSFQDLSDPEAWLQAETAWRARELLRRCGGDRRRASRLLGVSQARLDELLESPPA